MKTKPLNPAILANSLLCSLLMMTTNPVSAGTIAQSPLFVTASLDPNIMFIIDDSGSMNLSFVPDSLCQWNSSTSLWRNLTTEIVATTASINGLAYNPNNTYTPPLDATGTSLGNSVFASAWPNGHAIATRATSTKTNLGASGYKPTFSSASAGCDGQVSTVTPTTASSAFYYKYDTTTASCPAAGDIYNKNCYKKIIVSTSSGPGGTNETQNFANWYSYYRTRLMTTKTGASLAFAQLGDTPRVGYGKINTTSTIVQKVLPFSGTDRKGYFDWLFKLTGSGMTPLRRALDAAGAYYSNDSLTDVNSPWYSTGGKYYSCRQSYTIMMTDGYWNDAQATTTKARDDNDGSNANSTTNENPGKTISYKYDPPVAPFRDKTSGTQYKNTLADIAMYYWKRDLCPTNLINNVPVSKHDPAFWQHMATYGIGLGVPTVIDPVAAFAAVDTGSDINWPDPKTSDTTTISVPSRIDDLLHAAVNGHGGFFNATDTYSFVRALKDTLNAITENSKTSASAAAANSTSLQGDTLLYLAKFKPVDWYGTLQAFPIDQTTGAIVTPENWEASERLPAAPDRKIMTFNPAASASPFGSKFSWTFLTGTQQGHLNKLGATSDSKGEKRLNWLRGDTANEQRFTGGIFRNRTGGLLGDIVNSDPTFVGTPDYGYSALTGTEGSSYSSFRSDPAYVGRTPTIYVGANDGMLHAFDARKNTSTAGTGGIELFAYIPNILFPELSKLSDPGYIHQYYVDGNSAVGDAYFDSSWHTLLVGSTGAGGRALFGLDVTDPNNFGTDDVLWEFTNANDSDLGYTMAQANIVRTNDESHPWVVIVGNGYNSNNGHAVLMVLDAKSGTLLHKIDTGAGSPSNKNGLSSPLTVDTNGDKKIDAVYAGDLLGNLWKFDFSGTAAGSWAVAYTSGGTNRPLFVACTTAGTPCTDRQPITGKPNAGAVGSDQAGGLMIYFGTGKYFESGDDSLGTSPQTQTFYGIWDQGTPVLNRADLQEQNIVYEGFPTTVKGIVATRKQRIVSNNAVCYTTTSVGCTASSPVKKGWALNLLENGTSAKGERVVSYPLVRRGFVIFSTIIPDPDPCIGGGKGWLMEVGAFTGGRTDISPFDVNDDLLVNGDDKVTHDGQPTSTSGMDMGIGLHDTVTVVEDTLVDHKYASGSTGAGHVTDYAPPPPTPSTPPAPNTGRQAWRQLR